MSADPALQAGGAEVLALVHRMIRLLSLYEANNSAIGTVLGDLEEALERWFGQGHHELSLRVLPDECFVNGRLIKLDAGLYARTVDLSEMLGRFGVGAITFRTGCARQDLDALCTAAAASIRSGESRFADGGYDHVELGPVEGRSVASFRFRPDRLALALYASLLDVVDKLNAEQERGGNPSLLPVRRLLQMMIDTMRDHSGIYQMLTTVRDPDGALSRARLRVAIAVDLMGVGLFIGLDNNALMTLALAGLLSGEGTVEETLFALPGLGTAGLSLVETVAGGRRALAGEEAPAGGRILAVVERYHELTSAAGDDAIAAAAALGAMKAGQVPGADPAIAKLFAWFKGPFPLGSAVELDDGTEALVVSQGRQARGKVRPVVAPILDDGTLGPWVDLATVDTTIAQWLSPADVELDLLGVRGDLAMLADEDDVDEDFVDSLFAMPAVTDADIAARRARQRAGANDEGEVADEDEIEDEDDFEIEDEDEIEEAPTPTP